MSFFVLFVEKEPEYFVAEITGDNVALMEKKLESSTQNCYISAYETEQSFKDGRVGVILKSRTVQ